MSACARAILFSAFYGNQYNLLMQASEFYYRLYNYSIYFFSLLQVFCRFFQIFCVFVRKISLAGKRAGCFPPKGGRKGKCF